MKPAQGTSSLIRGLFPGYEELVDRGLSEHPAFLELCEDYRRCSDALENLRKPGDADRPERVREYEDLLDELALELEASLAVMSGRRDGPGRPDGK